MQPLSSKPVQFQSQRDFGKVFGVPRASYSPRPMPSGGLAPLATTNAGPQRAMAARRASFGNELLSMTPSQKDFRQPGNHAMQRQNAHIRTILNGQYPSARSITQHNTTQNFQIGALDSKVFTGLANSESVKFPVMSPNHIQHAPSLSNDPSIGRIKLKYERKAGLTEMPSQKQLMADKLRPVRIQKLAGISRDSKQKSVVKQRPLPPPGVGGYGIKSDLTDQLMVAGKFEDSSMTNAQLKVYKANYAAKQAEQQLIRRRNQEQMKTLMADKLGFTKKDIVKLNFKDELQILKQMKRRHARLVNAEAAAKIQKIARGFITRLLVRPIIMKRRAACIVIQRFFKRYSRMKNMRDKLFNLKYYASVVIQKYLRGYLANQQISNLKSKMRLQANLQYFEDIKIRFQTDAQIKIAYAWRKHAKILHEQRRQKKELEAKAAQELSEIADRKSQESGLTSDQRNRSFYKVEMVKGPEPSPDAKLNPRKGEGIMSAAVKKAKQDKIRKELPDLINIQIEKPLNLQSSTETQPKEQPANAEQSDKATPEPVAEKEPPNMFNAPSDISSPPRNNSKAGALELNRQSGDDVPTFELTKMNQDSEAPTEYDQSMNDGQKLPQLAQANETYGDISVIKTSQELLTGGVTPNSKSHAMLPNPSFDSLTAAQVPLRNQSKVLLHGDESGELTLADSKVGEDKISSKMAKEQSKRNSRTTLQSAGGSRLNAVKEENENQEQEEEK